MRKIAYSIFALLLIASVTLTATAQIDETRAVSDFTKIGSGGSFDVHVKIDGTESVKLVGKAETINKIETKVQDGMLVIQWKDSWKDHNEDHWGRVDIYVTAKSLSSAGNAGSGNMTIEGALTGEKVDITLSGSGSITCEVKTANLHSGQSGSGSVNLRGSADEAKIALSGSGTFNSKELKTGNARVDVAGSGNVSLIVDKTISGHIAGSGNVVYTGDATEENVGSSGSGRFHKE